MTMQLEKRTVRLNMIVKNEAHVIARCLQSVAPCIDSWVIVDTGSSDETPALIQEVLGHLPGELHHRPWVDFGHNRSEALTLAMHMAPSADYLFFMDADDQFIAPNGFKWPLLTEDAYALTLQNQTLRYARTALVSTRLNWHWEGVLHEYLEATPPATAPPVLEGCQIQSSREGARSRDPDKYLNDAKILRQALKRDPRNARNAFYLAQSLRDADLPHDALHAYQKRMQMAGWVEENWRAHLEAARLMAQLKHPASRVEQAYLHAFELRVQRAEPLVDLARFMRLQGRYAKAYLYAGQACKLPMPNDLLFVELPAYGWQRWDELAVAAYHVGEFAESARICQLLLEGEPLPETQRQRVQDNLLAAKDMLGKP